MKIKYFFIILFFFESNAFCPLKRADLAAFSYDRPLQLYSFLESVKKYISGLGEIHVVYRSSCKEFDNAYEIVKQAFPDVNFNKQFVRSNNFKEVALKLIFESPSKYILFGVDDIIVKDYIDIRQCINALENTGSYGFYLRMGKNIVECYMHFNESTPVPRMNSITDDIFQWNFQDGKGDWKYPNSIDMTLYKKSDIKEICNYNFQNPSALEGVWADRAIYDRMGLCFEQSKIVNLPLNLVIDEARNIDNRYAAIFTTNELLEKFNNGLKIDINKFYKINNLAPHAAIIPEFVKRVIS